MRRVYWFLSVLAVIAAGLLLSAQSRDRSLEPYKNPKLSVEERVEDLLRRMTLEEKADLLNGAGWMETRTVPRLGIPELKMADGPMGVRSWLGPSAETNTAAAARPITATAFPAGIAIASTWDTELVGREGRAIGQETKALGRDMILGPTVNIARVPQWGRNFEGYGEDPYLASRLAVAYIKGVQSEGVIATVKHFAANNEEFERRRIDEKISERALHEIYLPAFKAAVQEAGVWSVMSAYNKVNGAWCAENPYLLTDVLKNKWGFKGFVVSDWMSTHSTAATVQAGLDLEMPSAASVQDRMRAERKREPGSDGGYLARDKVLAAVAAKQVTPAAVDDHVRRLLRAMIGNGLLDNPHTATGAVDTPEQRAIARNAATESIVLLKNAGGILPLAADRIHSLAVIGPNAAVARSGGGGSSQVRPSYSVTPLEAIREAAGPKVQVRYALGVPMEKDPAPANVDLAQALSEAVSLARTSEAALVFAGYAPWLESEGFDRKSLELPAGQDDLIRAVVKANPRTVVVIHAGGPVLVEKWIDQVPALLLPWYGGQETGHAIADVLFGNANASGKLPVTFPKRWDDSSAYGHYPGENLAVEYGEGIYVGYRHFDRKNIEPRFPFGYGLSYTTFEYSGLKVTPSKAASGNQVQVQVQIRNTGARRGAEVIQLYVRDVESSVDRPVKELKAFRRVELSPRESQTVAFTLDRSAMAFYDPGKKDWVVEPGMFEVQVGGSSREIRLKGSFEIAR